MGWLTGWLYRKSHTVNGSTASSVTDYQVRITVYYGSGTDSGDNVYLNGKCRTDFGDVRFTDSDGTTLLSYWIESYTASSVAYFWVKIPSIPQNGSSTIYIYYGNSSATTTSDGNTTFLFFDHFDTLDTTKWTTYGSPSVSNSILTVLATNNAYVWSNTSFTPPFAVRCKWRNSVSNTDGVGLQLDNGNETWDSPDFSCTAGWNNQTQFTIDGLGGSRAGIGLALDTNFHVWDVKVKSGTVSTLTDGAYPMSRTGSTASAYNLWLKAWVYSLSGAKGEFDWVLVRKYVDPEPTNGVWGTEEVPTTISYYDELNNGVNFDDASVSTIFYSLQNNGLDYDDANVQLSILEYYETFNNGLNYDDVDVTLSAVGAYYDVLNNGVNFDDSSVSLTVSGAYYDELNNGVNFDDASVTLSAVGAYYDELNNGVNFDDASISVVTVPRPYVPPLVIEQYKPILIEIMLLSMVVSMFKALKDKIRRM